MDDQLIPPLGAEFQNRNRFIDAAEIGVGFAEHLHRHPRAMPVFAQEFARAHEVFVRVIAFPHFLDGKVEDGGIEAFAARSHSAPTRPGERGGERIAVRQRELAPDIVEPPANRAERLRPIRTGDAEADDVRIERERALPG